MHSPFRQGELWDDRQDELWDDRQDELRGQQCGDTALLEDGSHR